MAISYTETTVKNKSKQAILAGFCASLVGIGLARFAYTPLLPAIIDAQWFTSANAAYLGAANLVGYLIGALCGRPLANKLTSAFVLRLMMVLATVTFFACSQPVSFLWFFCWRVLAGISGGALMVLAAPSVLPLVIPARRGLAGGIIFMGVGLGIAASGTLVPLLLQNGLKVTWAGLGMFSLLLTVIAWKGWPDNTSVTTPHPTSRSLHLKSLKSLYVQYGLNAAGWVPHMIFLVDFVAHGLGQGLAVGSQYWVLFGIGASVGPVLVGAIADKIGFGNTLRLAFLLEIFGVAIPALSPNAFWLIASSLIVGGFVTGTVPLVLGRIHELLEHHPTYHAAAWKTATVGFALSQAAAAYVMSFVFSISGGNYQLLFYVGSIVMSLALLIELTTTFGGSIRDMIFKQQ